MRKSLSQTDRRESRHRPVCKANMEVPTPQSICQPIEYGNFTGTEFQQVYHDVHMSGCNLIVRVRGNREGDEYYMHYCLDTEACFVGRARVGRMNALAQLVTTAISSRCDIHLVLRGTNPFRVRFVEDLEDDTHFNFDTDDKPVISGDGNMFISGASIHQQDNQFTLMRLNTDGHTIYVDPVHTMNEMTSIIQKARLSHTGRWLMVLPLDSDTAFLYDTTTGTVVHRRRKGSMYTFELGSPQNYILWCTDSGCHLERIVCKKLPFHTIETFHAIEAIAELPWKMEMDSMDMGNITFEHNRIIFQAEVDVIVLNMHDGRIINIRMIQAPGSAIMRQFYRGSAVMYMPPTHFSPIFQSSKRLAVLRNFTLPWSLTRHNTYAPQFRSRVWLIMLLQQRIASRSEPSKPPLAAHQWLSVISALFDMEINARSVNSHV
jgi:hypothetical protein